MNRTEAEQMAEVINEILGDETASEVLGGAYERITGKPFPDEQLYATPEEFEQAAESWSEAQDDLVGDALVLIGESIKGARYDYKEKG